MAAGGVGSQAVFVQCTSTAENTYIAFFFFLHHPFSLWAPAWILILFFCSFVSVRLMSRAGVITVIFAPSYELLMKILNRSQSRTDSQGGPLHTAFHFNSEHLRAAFWVLFFNWLGTTAFHYNLVLLVPVWGNIKSFIKHEHLLHLHLQVQCSCSTRELHWFNICPDKSTLAFVRWLFLPCLWEAFLATRIKWVFQ